MLRTTADKQQSPRPGGTDQQQPQLAPQHQHARARHSPSAPKSERPHVRLLL